MPSDANDPMFFVLWLTLTMIAQFPLRLHDKSRVMGAGQQLICNLVELTPLGIQLYDMMTCSRTNVSRFPDYLIVLAVQDRVEQITRVIRRAILYHSGHDSAQLQEFIIVAMMQLNKLLSPTIPIIKPSRLCAKVRVCNTIIEVCTSMLDLSLCRYDAYCNHQTQCGGFHWSLDSIARMKLSVKDSRFVDWVYQKYQHQICAVFYNRGGQYQLHLFNKAYRHLYKKSFVKMSKHLFIRVLLRIRALELIQVPCKISVSFRSKFIQLCAAKDRGNYDVIRREYRRNIAAIAAAVREENRDLFIEQQLRNQPLPGPS